MQRYKIQSMKMASAIIIYNNIFGENGTEKRMVFGAILNVSTYLQSFKIALKLLQQEVKNNENKAKDTNAKNLRHVAS